MKANIIRSIKSILVLVISFSSIKAENINYFVIGSTAAPFQISKKNSPQKGIVTEIIERIKTSEIRFETLVFPFKRYVKALENSDSHWLTYGSPRWHGITPKSTYSQLDMFSSRVKVESSIKLVTSSARE